MPPDRTDVLPLILPLAQPGREEAARRSYGPTGGDLRFRAAGPPARVNALSIEPARTEDLPTIVTIYNHYVERTAATFEVSPVTADDRRAWFGEHAQGGRHRLLVARGNGEGVVGWASTSPFRPRAAYATTVEASVYCAPSSTGQGVGTALYRELFAALRSQDVERIVAGIALPNDPSVALHRRFGFRSVGTFTRVGRKFGRYWDVEWFERPRTVGDSSTATGPTRSAGSTVNPDGPDAPPGR